MNFLPFNPVDAQRSLTLIVMPIGIDAIRETLSRWIFQYCISRLTLNETILNKYSNARSLTYVSSRGR